MSLRSVISTTLSLALVLAAATAVQAEDYTPNGSIFTGLPARTANSVTAEMYADTMLTSLSAQRAFRNTLPTTHTYSQTAHRTAGDDCVDGKNWVMWDTPFLVHESRKRDDYLGYKNTVSGFATGISRLIGDTGAIGLAVGYDGRKMTNRDSYHWRQRGDAFHAALYGGGAIGCFFVDGYAGYSKTWQSTERDVILPTGDYFSRNHGNYSDTILSAGVKANYVAILPDDTRIVPSVGFDYAYMRQGGFTETMSRNSASDIAQLRVNRTSHNVAQMPIAVAVNKTFTSEFLTFGGTCSMWTPEIRAAWVPQFGSRHTDVRSSLVNVGDVSFNSKSSSLGRSYGTVGTGLKIKLRDKYIFAVDYNYYFRDKYSNHTVTGTYGVSF